jgi:hypothetical protein
MFVNDLILNACVKSTEIFISEKILTNLNISTSAINIYQAGWTRYNIM